MNVAPVNIDVNLHANQIGDVLISQNKDVAIAAGGKLTATAGGFIFIGSQDTIELNTVVGGTTNNPANVRIKTQGDLLNDAIVAGAINVTGEQIVLEAGQGFIGTGTSSTTAVQVDILGATGSLTCARARQHLYRCAGRRHSGRRDLFGVGPCLPRCQRLDL